MPDYSLHTNNHETTQDYQFMSKQCYCARPIVQNADSNSAINTLNTNLLVMSKPRSRHKAVYQWLRNLIVALAGTHKCVICTN